MVGHIARTIECTWVRNTRNEVMPRGTIVSFHEDVADNARSVRPTLISAPQCKQQYAGVLEADLGATADPNAPTNATARHCGGPVYTLMGAGLTPHVGDSVWATGNAPGGYGQLTTTGAPAIYIGMIAGLGDYNPAAPAGTTGVIVLLKHGSPEIAV
jgi:hypothetical protein